MQSSIFLVLIFTNLFPQVYDMQESAVYDSANDRYLISNTGNGDIISVPRLNPGNLSYFNQGDAASVRGLVLVGNTLYAAGTGNDATENLFAFDMTTGSVINTITINYDINVESIVRITVYDLLGGEVVQLINNIEQPGTKSVMWDGRDSERNMVKAGVYISKLNVGTFSQTK